MDNVEYNKDDIFIVTGASSGIGKGVALKLNELGAKVIATARNEKKLQQVNTECKYKDNFLIEPYDLSNTDELDKWTLALSKKYGKLRGLVLNAGVLQIAPISMPNYLQKSKDLFEVNYFANTQIIKGFSHRAANIGQNSSIVFISSIASVIGESGLSAYSASKGAINSIVKSLAKELSRLKIRVNAILPGTTNTDILKSYTKEYLDKTEQQIPLGIGEIQDIVEPIVFLLSNRTKWITGSIITVDGGQSL